MDDRSASIKIGGQEYELLLTIRATKEIGKKYGGLAELGETLMTAQKFDDVLSEVMWLLVLLANQPIHAYNLTHKDSPKDLLTEEMVELLMIPSDLVDFKDAIMIAINKGMNREILSVEDGKNQQAG